MELCVIRHLETKWNRQGLLQGKQDTDILPISEAITASILENSAILKKIGLFDKVLVSTLKRTHQTALAYGISEFFIEPLIDEIDFGLFEGKTRKDLLNTFQTEWEQDPRHLVLGESIQQLEGRIRACLKKYRSCQRILVFSHGSWMRGLLSLVRIGSLQDMNKIEIRNNQLITLEISVGEDGS